MKSKTLKLISEHDSLILSVMLCTPDTTENIQGILQFSHGMTEHKERYLNVMKYFTSKGYICIIHDHRGHGKSVKNRDDLGYFYEDGATGIVEDLRRVSEYVKDLYPDLPLYLIAHSMGTLVTRVYLKKYDYIPSGVFLCGAPSSDNSTGVITPVLDKYAKLRGDHYKDQLINDLFVGIFDFVFKDENQKSAWICSDKNVVDEFVNDPLCGFSFTINGYMGLLELLNRTYLDNTLTAGNPMLPIIFMSGCEDSCMLGYKKHIEAVSKQQEAGYYYVGSKMYAGMRHERLNEIGKEQVYEDILKHIELFKQMKKIL